MKFEFGSYPRCVVQSQNWVSREVDGLVARRALHHRRVHVKPVRGDVQGHGELEQNGPARIEHCQYDAQTHGRTAIGEHVEHGAELRALVQVASRMTIKCIQKST